MSTLNGKIKFEAGSGAPVGVSIKTEGGIGDVVANPEVAGTETELTALKVGDTKYKITQNPTVPTIPSAPTTAGSYKLVVDSEGAASWVAIE